MKNPKCECVGCKSLPAVEIQKNWGKLEVIGFCATHAPEWAKAGLMGSPEATMFGQTKSWYSLVVGVKATFGKV